MNVVSVVVVVVVVGAEMKCVYVSKLDLAKVQVWQQDLAAAAGGSRFGRS